MVGLGGKEGEASLLPPSWGQGSPQAAVRPATTLGHLLDLQLLDLLDLHIDLLDLHVVHVQVAKL